LVGGVGVAVEGGVHLVSEAGDEGAGVDGGAAVVEVDAWVVLLGYLAGCGSGGMGLPFFM